MDDKATILAMLDKFARQRPGLEFGNYGDWKAYRSELRSITRDLADVRQLMRAVELSGITAEQLKEAFRAYSGRLTLTQQDGKYTLSYCIGQYFPTEYRKAVCAVLAAALWTYKRDFCMPEGSRQGASEGVMLYTLGGGKGHVSAGEWLRRSFARDFGRGIASRWFQ